jgi:DNA-binding NarL/FixJ family response regulator
VLTAAGLVAILGRQQEFELVPQPHIADVVIADYQTGVRIARAGQAGKVRVLILTHTDSEVEICHALEQGVRGYVFLGGSIDELRSSLQLVHLGEVALGRGVAGRIAVRMQCKALTRREVEVLGYVMSGLSNKAIAANLKLAVGTIKTHVKSILEKLDARSRTQAAAIAQRRGILRSGERSSEEGTACAFVRPVAPSSANESTRVRTRLKRRAEQRTLQRLHQQGDLR